MRLLITISFLICSCGGGLLIVEDTCPDAGDDAASEPTPDAGCTDGGQ